MNFSGLDRTVNYTGHDYDEILEKYFAQARLYDPLTKRFIAKDEAGYSKISEPITLNLYVYGSQNPLTNVDPTGRAGERVADSNRSRGYYTQWRAGGGGSRPGRTVYTLSVYIHCAPLRDHTIIHTDRCASTKFGKRAFRVMDD